MTLDTKALEAAREADEIREELALVIMQQDGEFQSLKAQVLEFDDMVEKLQALCDKHGCEPGTDRIEWLSDMLDASATPSRNDILEEAAMVADEYADEQAQEIAAAIRALVKPEEQPPMNNPNPYRGW